MKSILRGRRLVTLMLLLFLAGMVVLVVRIQLEASFYISQSGKPCYGMVYDREGDVLFDGINGYSGYESGHFADIGSLIGDTSGQMTNTLVARNLELLTNYSFTTGMRRDGKSAITTTLDHAANQATYKAFGKKDGIAIAYNYKTGEMLVNVSKPCVDVAKGYGDIANFPEGSLLCKAFYGTVPGSTQKVSTVIAATEILGAEQLESLSYSCGGSYLNDRHQSINCHKSSGHGQQDIIQAFANSCNPFFAQLLERSGMPLDRIISVYRGMGYAVNGDQKGTISIDGILSETASTTLQDIHDFDTQWGCMGQGETLVSPCQLMMWQSAVANGTGVSTKPHLIASVTNVSGKVTQTAVTEYTEQLFSSAAAQEVRKIMLDNGKNHYVASGKIRGYDIGVKSGTAQVNGGKEENSLLVGFVNDPAFPIAFCVVIENRVGGEVATHQIVQQMLDALK